jgi:GNAT superfamily N-acetyltransferase
MSALPDRNRLPRGEPAPPLLDDGPVSSVRPVTVDRVLDDDVQVRAERSPDLAEVLALYRAVGWTRYTDDPATLAAALDGSTRVVVARSRGRLVGLARVVSDGASVAYLQDVLVEPAQQRGGVGQALVRAALDPYARVRQKVLLTDDEPGQRAFYESLGFTETTDVPGGPLRAFVRMDC